MLFNPLFAVTSVALAALVAADGTTSSGTSAPTSSPNPSPKTITVKVSDEKSTLRYSPEVITANAGDMVQFEFFPSSHSVAQSSFDNPCQPSTDSDAFWSGFVAVQSTSNLPTFTITIDDPSKPKWFYCALANHCETGMVGVINPPSSGQTLDQYRSAAAGVSSTVVPSGSPTDGNGGNGSGNGGTGGNATGSAGSTPTSGSGGSGSSGSGGGGYGSGAEVAGARGWAVALVGLLAAGALVI